MGIVRDGATRHSHWILITCFGGHLLDWCREEWIFRLDDFLGGDNHGVVARSGVGLLAVG